MTGSTDNRPFKTIKWVLLQLERIASGIFEPDNLIGSLAKMKVVICHFFDLSDGGINVLNKKRQVRVVRHFQTAFRRVRHNMYNRAVLPEPKAIHQCRSTFTFNIAKSEKRSVKLSDLIMFPGGI